MPNAPLAIRVVSLIAALMLACSSGDETSTTSEETSGLPELVALGELATRSPDALNQDLAAARAALSDAETSLERARAARIAARLARAAAAQSSDTAPTPTDMSPRLARIAEARAWLTAALAAPQSGESWELDAELCEAGLDLERLESIAAADQGAAARVVQALVERFAVDDARPDGVGAAEAQGQSRLLECLARARRVRTALASVQAEDAGVPAGAPAPTDAAPRADEPQTPTLTELSVYSGGSAGARAVLRFDRAPTYQEGRSLAGAGQAGRVWVDLPGAGVMPGVGTEWAVGDGGLTRVRRLLSEDGSQRVIFDLEPGARHRLFVLPEPYRLVVDIESQTSVARSVRPRLPAGAPHPTRVIVLDPGHGGTERGATAGSLRESHVALDLARRVALLLRRMLPHVRVLLTRQQDVTLSLEQRTAMANAVGADLFVSIHLNAADEPVEHGGVTTFVLDTDNQRQALRLAARENGTSTRDVTELQRLLAGLHRRDQVAQSRDLADCVHQGTLAGGRRILPRLPDRGVRSAMFHVLVGARMPAVLLEASFLSKPEEARALATPRYRQALAEGIAAGIQRYVIGS